MIWPVVALRDACTITMGQAPAGASYNTSGTGMPLIAGAGDFKNGKLAPSKFTSSPTKLTRVNDIVLSIRASIGAKVWADGEYCLGRGVAGIRSNDEIDARFLWHYLTQAEKELASKGKGATFLQVNRKDIGELEVPLPSIDEQRRIAEILDCGARIRGFRERSKKLAGDVQSTSFIKLFGSPTNWDDRWPMGTIGDIAESTQYGTSEKSGPDGSTPVLRMGNITNDGRLDTRDLKYMNLAAADREKYTVRRGDILFNRTNSPELVGKTAVVRTDDHFAFAGYLIRLRLVDEFEPDFVSGYLNSTYGKVLLRSMCKSIVGQANINARELRRIPIALPPARVQREYRDVVSRVERHSALLATSDRTVNATLASLQSRAFRGEL